MSAAGNPMHLSKWGRLPILAYAMEKRTSLLHCAALAHACLFGLLGAPVSLAQTQSVLISGLEAPARIIVTPQRNLLVTEAGTITANTARLSRVSESGGATTILDDLPSAVAPDNLAGPWQPVLLGENILFLVIGTGDTTVSNAAGAEVPNPSGPSSPLFSSVLQVTFSKPIDRSAGGFVLTLDQQRSIANGHPVPLHNTAGETATFFLVHNFADIIRDDEGQPRRSNTFGAALTLSGLYVSDASRNDLQRVDLLTDRAVEVAQFPDIPNTRGFGPPMVEAVPTGVADYHGALLVSEEGGFPFTPGAAEVKLVNPATGTVTSFIKGLTSATDILVSTRNGMDTFYVLELSTDPLNGGPGELLQYNTPTSTPIVLSSSLVFPAGVARDPVSGAFYVTQFFTGEIVQITP